MIAIIDYGAGNLHSVAKAFRFIGADARIVSDPDETGPAHGLVLPGVGAFGSAMAKLRNSSFYQTVLDWSNSSRPMLGICLGLQLLLESSEESAGVQGFGIVPGTNRRFTQGKVPHIGWNRVSAVNRGTLFAGIPDGAHFYFVHSYYADPEKGEYAAGVTDYGRRYVSAIENDNIFAVQFHPEKSGDNGMQLLKNWVALC